MSKYTIKKASYDDIEFLIETIVEAEKGGTDKFGFASMLNLSEDVARTYIKRMLEEDIDGCEFSISSFLIASVEGEKVAAIGGWIEGMNEYSLPSSTIKSNLFSYILPLDNIKYMSNNLSKAKLLQIDRKWQTLQIEYVYVKPEYRGKHFAEILITKHIENARQHQPDIDEAYIQLFGSNIHAKSIYEHLGFSTCQTIAIEQNNILNYFPDKVKINMIKYIKL